MKKCIYCCCDFNDKSREHVIPQGFGVFSHDTWTLNSVCKDCNHYFGNNLDITLLKDSFEGVHRYKYNNRNSKSEFRNSLLKFTVPENSVFKNIRGAFLELSHKKNEINLVNQIRLYNNDTNKDEFFLERDF